MRVKENVGAESEWRLRGDYNIKTDGRARVSEKRKGEESPA